MNILDVKNPYTGQLIKQYQMNSIEQCKEKYKLAETAQLKWRATPLLDRISLVDQALSYFTKNDDTIAKDISEQMGRPIRYTPGEINGLLERAKYLCSIAEKTLSPHIIESSQRFQKSIHREPLGVVFILSAWNYPLLVTINSVVPALLAGNTVLLKHSSQTPGIGAHFEKAFGTLGSNKNLLQNIIVNHSTAGEIIETLNINQVVFTGSVSGGQKVLEHTSKKFIQPQLELGGKDGAYVAEDADIPAAAASLVDGAFFNSGQSCCGIERVYVHQDVAEEFISQCLSLTREYKLGDPLNQMTTLGPLISEKAAQLMTSQIDEALTMGAKLLTGGKSEKINEGIFFQPTLLTHVPQRAQLIQEENFGPILPILVVDSMTQAISFINDSDYGLTSAIFTPDKNKAEEFAEHVQTGTVFMNRCDYLDPSLPWTGVRNSGCGSSLSYLGFHSLTRAKSLHFKIEKD